MWSFNKLANWLLFAHFLWSYHCLDWVLPYIATKHSINSGYVFSNVTFCDLHEHTSSDAKCMSSMGLPKRLDQCMSINQHLCLHVSILNIRGSVKSSHKDADQVCLRCCFFFGICTFFTISTVRPAMTILTRRCSSFLPPLIDFVIFYVVDTLSFYRSAKIF